MYCVLYALIALIYVSGNSKFSLRVFIFFFFKKKLRISSLLLTKVLELE